MNNNNLIETDTAREKEILYSYGNKVIDTFEYIIDKDENIYEEYENIYKQL